MAEERELTPEEKLRLQVEKKAFLEGSTQEFNELLSGLDPKEKQIILNSMIRKQLGVSSNTYFNEQYALQIMDDLPTLLEDKEKKKCLFYPYNNYPQWKKGTLLNYVTEAFRYLVQFLDKNEVYKVLREQVDVSGKEDGVYILWKKKVSKQNKILRAIVLDQSKAEQTQTVKEAELESYSQAVTWENELIDFMETTTEKGAAWRRSGLKVTEEQKEKWEQAFTDSIDFGGMFTAEDDQGTYGILVRRLS